MFKFNLAKLHSLLEYTSGAIYLSCAIEVPPLELDVITTFIKGSCLICSTKEWYRFVKPISCVLLELILKGLTRAENTVQSRIFWQKGLTEFGFG